MFDRTRCAAFVAERERWAASGQDVVHASEVTLPQADDATRLPEGISAIVSPVAGSLWKVLVDVGQYVERGTPVLIVEAMKTEISVRAQVSGRVHALRIAEGEPVSPGKPLVLLAT